MFAILLIELGIPILPKTGAQPGSASFGAICAFHRDSIRWIRLPKPIRVSDGNWNAKLTGDRRMEMAPLKEVQPLTGYIRGGVTAFGCRKDYPVFVDETAILFDVISVSAGARGSQILLAPVDYLRALNATTGTIAR